MQSIYPYRKRAFIYFGILIGLIVLGAGSSVSSNAYSSSSAINGGLSVMAGLSFFLFAIFVIPFASFARKYWGTERIDNISEVAEPGIHSLSIKYADPEGGPLAWQRNPAILSWDNSRKTMYLTAGSDSSAQQPRIFESTYSNIQKFDINLYGLTIKVSDTTYHCVLADTRNIAPYVGAGFAIANIIRGSLALNAAGAPELVARLQAAGAPATYNKINKAFEYTFDGIFAVLFIGMLTLVYFNI